MEHHVTQLLTDINTIYGVRANIENFATVINIFTVYYAVKEVTLLDLRTLMRNKDIVRQLLPIS